MSHEEPQGDVRPADIAAGHEPSEVGIGRIFVFGAALISLTAVAMLLLAGLMRGFSAEEKKDGTTTADLVKEEPGDFPAPRLQRNTTYDMVEFRKQEEAALSSYGWEDAKAGIARIPIDRAMDLLIKNGLPKPKPPQPPDTKPGPPEKPPTPTPKPTTEPGKKE